MYKCLVSTLMKSCIGQGSTQNSKKCLEPLIKATGLYVEYLIIRIFIDFLKKVGALHSLRKCLKTAVL